jgi:hypothetical protein
MKLLEIFRGGSEVQTMVRDCQRAVLQDMGVEVFVLDATDMPAASVEEVAEDFEHILMRGGELLSLLPVRLMERALLDHASPYEFGVSSQHTAKLSFLRRAFCYSTVAENDLRDAGLGRVRHAAGPYLPCVPTPLPGKTTVAVLDTSTISRQVLSSLVSERDDVERHWPSFDVVSTLGGEGVLSADSDLDAAVRATVVIAPLDRGDMGQSHDGAILALATGRALVTTRNSALSSMPYPSGSFVFVDPVSPRAYALMMTMFFENPGPYLSWPDKARTDYEEVPRLVVAELE